MLLYAEAHNKDDENTYWVCRLMIDKRYQSKGYGKEAMTKALEVIRKLPCGKASTVFLSYEPENIVAKKLYASLGFKDTGNIEEGEMVVKLDL